MPLADLNDAEKHVVFECLKCVATGTVIPLREIARVFPKWRGEPVGNYVEGLK